MQKNKTDNKFPMLVYKVIGIAAVSGVILYFGPLAGVTSAVAVEAVKNNGSEGAKKATPILDSLSVGLQDTALILGIFAVLMAYTRIRTKYLGLPPIMIR